MKDKLTGIFNSLKNADYLVKLVCFASVFVISVIISLAMSDVKFAYNVSYGENGEAVVETKQTFEDAKALALTLIEEPDKDELIYKPRYTLTLTLGERIEDSSKVAETILENTEEIKKSYALNIDGVNMAYLASREELEGYIADRLSQYNVENYENTPSFMENVTVNDVYCKATSLNSADKVIELMSSLNVKTTVKVTQNIEINFSTVTQHSAEKLLGYRQVVKSGEKGINHIVEEVVYLNGQEVSRVNLGQEVVKEPVNRVVVVGTAYTDNSKTSGMIFPIPKDRHYVFTSYFKDRGGKHKGVDIAANKGTPIYASKSGTVIYAGYKSDYGYHVKINHGNGLVTLYAHCSELYVSVGQEVKQGQTIAAVGSTGQSTGPHVHFEVIKNGTNVNPIEYVGK